MTRRTGRSNSGDTFIGCLPAGLILLVVAGAALYLVVPGLLKDADRKVLPWLESKGRALMGQVSLHPLIKTIDRSELTGEEKQMWKDFLAEKWELASDSKDEKLRREVLINASRAAVETYPGMYYVLLAIGDRDFSDTSLTSRQVETGQQLITTITANMLDGLYAEDELISLKADLYTLLRGIRVETLNAQGRRERDKNLRDFLRALYRLDQKPEHQGDMKTRDMPEDFRQALEAFRLTVVAAEDSGPG